MKKTYSTPTVEVIKMDTKAAVLLTMSASERNTNEQLAREYDEYLHGDDQLFNQNLWDNKW